jgi:hypothetical protein
MVVGFPIAVLLAIGLVMSLRGKGTPWCAFLALSLGVVIANTEVGSALVDVVDQGFRVVSATGATLAK